MENPNEDKNVQPPAEGTEPKKMSKGELKKLEKAQKKAELKAAAKATQAAAAPKVEENTDMYGTKPLIVSATREKAPFLKVRDLDASKAGSSVLVRARIHASRGSGNLCFLQLRQGLYTIQAVIAKGQDVPKSMVNFASAISKESVVDVTGELVAVKEKIQSASQQDVEIQVKRLFIVSSSEPVPLQMEDLSRPNPLIKAQKAEVKKIEAQIKEVKDQLAGKEETEEGKKLLERVAELEKEKEAAKKFVVVKRATRLDNRVLDLRTPANQAIFRLQSAVCQLFREYLISQDFMEIHSPKIVGGGSEGGAEVFQLKYFDGFAYLAQSPQLYKQMVLMSDFGRVFEIAPVFRAENSFTRRHMTEFMGLDLEMTFYEHYHEVLDVLDGLFVHIFDGITKRFSKELEIISQQYPFEPFKYNVPSLRLQYKDGIALLKEAGVEIGDYDDINTAQEIMMGELIKKKHGVDFYILDRFPTDVRPFYTMPANDDPKYSNSYDFFMRGQEIMSGAQRVHDPALLTERAKAKGVPPESIKPYIDSFKYGSVPHGGGGVGLERVVMLYLGLKNIRQTCLFPRDPKRTSP